MRNELNVGDNKTIYNPNSVSFDEREEELKRQAELEELARKKAKNSPYSNFYQFNRDYSKEMIYLAGKHPKAHQILLFLLDQMDNYNAVMCSYKVFQEALGMSDSTAKRAVKILKENNFIKIYKSGSANIYAVNKKLAWGSWGTNYKYAKFEANIIISENEQDNEQNDDELKIKTAKHKEILIEKK